MINFYLFLTLFLSIAPIGAAAPAWNGLRLLELMESRQPRVEPCGSWSIEKKNEEIIKNMGKHPSNWSKQEAENFFNCGGVPSIALFDKLVIFCYSPVPNLDGLRVWLERGGSLNESGNFEYFNPFFGSYDFDQHTVSADRIDEIVICFGEYFDDPLKDPQMRKRGQDILEILLAQRAEYHDPEYLEEVIKRAFPGKYYFKNRVRNLYADKKAGLFQQLPLDMLHEIEKHLESPKILDE